MSRFVALDVEICISPDLDAEKQMYEGPDGGVEKYALADVEVAREADFGANDERLSTVTHLGHLINSGDVVMGYDLVATVGGDWEMEESFHSSFVVPDLVLVKKVASEAKEDKATDNKDAHGIEGKRRSTKKTERRQRKDGKRARDLEEHAARMGFVEEGGFNDIEAELANDPELAAEVSALERDFEALAMDLPANANDGENLDDDEWEQVGDEDVVEEVSPANSTLSDERS